MKIHLGRFARQGIEDHLGPDLRAGVVASLAHYARRLSSGPPPLGPPSFRREEPALGREPLELSLGPDAQATLQSEARLHGVSEGEILSHAILTYLAAIDRALEGSRALERTMAAEGSPTSSLTSVGAAAVVGNGSGNLDGIR
jgi:hypothetical protein